MSTGLSVFLNSLALMAVGACCAYIGLNACFCKRHSTAVFWAYMSTKAIVWSVHDALDLAGMLGGAASVPWDFAIAVFGVLTYIVLYFTWNTSFCKVGFAGVFVDAFSACSLMAAIYVSHILVGAPEVGDYRACLGPGTAIVAVGNLALFQAIVLIAKPVIRWFANYKIVHEKMWAIAFVVIIIFFTFPRMDYAALMANSVPISFALLIVLLVCLLAYVRQLMRAEGKRKELLLRERQLAGEYDRALSEQLEYLDASAVALDAIAVDVAQTTRAIGHDGLASYAAQLDAVCARLRYGVYSDWPALDVVLTSFETAFEARGWKVDYRISPLGSASNQAALVAQSMLGWVMEEYEGGGKEGPLALCLRISRKRNQLVFVLQVPSNRKERFPHRLLEERSIAFQGVLLENDDGSCKTVRALVGEDQPWNGR